MNNKDSLIGKLLLAMPAMGDPRFQRAVILICAHNEDGAMGLIINQQVEDLNYDELLKQLKIDVEGEVADVTIHEGGPVETGRGFVLHSADYVQDTTTVVSETLALTATVDILKAMAENKGPIHSLLALGYAGWGEGQLEQEMIDNAWLTSHADDEIIFNTLLEDKWPRAMKMIGVDVSKLSSDAGHA